MSEGLSDGAGGAAADATIGDYARLPDLGKITRRQWGKLPPRLARDLMQGRREKVAEEYRQMVETYFRVIAEKARKKAK